MSQPCPPRSVWQKIVADGFVDISFGGLGAHLDGCSACQAAVEKLMGREQVCLAIATELRRELPPAPPVCQRTLEEFRDKNPSGPIKSDDFTTPSQGDEEAPTKAIICPYCLERVRLKESLGCTLPHCPLCGRTVGGEGQQEPLPDYQVNNQVDDRPMNREIRDYVHSLEETARKEHEREPYHRGGFPVNLVVGVLLVICGLLVLVTAFIGQSGPMSSLVNGILPATMLIIIGAACLVIWSKQ